jgi:RsiW-degrading membrane proteinase PrsW (M82 family)
VGSLDAFVVQVLFGAGTVILNLAGMGIWALAAGSLSGQAPSDLFRQPWQTMFANPSSLYLIGYVASSAFAGFAYLMAASNPEVVLSILTALTAAYPLVTTILMFAIFREFDKINLRLAVPGMLLTAAGCILLALSPKAETSPSLQDSDLNTNAQNSKVDLQNTP